MRIRDFIKGKFEDIVNQQAQNIGKLPDFNRVKIELYLYAYLIIAFATLIFVQGFVYNTIQTIIFSVGLVGFVLKFISHCKLYNKLKFLNQFRFKGDNNGEVGE